MNKILLAILSLGLVTTAPMADAARVSVDLDRGITIRDRGHHRDRDFHRHHRRHSRFHRPERLLSETKRIITERDGDRVVITRRVYLQPDGDRVVRESRRVINR